MKAEQITSEDRFYSYESLGVKKEDFSVIRAGYWIDNSYKFRKFSEYPMSMVAYKGIGILSADVLKIGKDGLRLYAFINWVPHNDIEIINCEVLRELLILECDGYK